MRALVIIDVQYDFLPGGALAVTDGDKVIPVINAAQPSFSLVVATQDWHPADHKSFAVNNGRKVGEVIETDGLPQVMWPAHCVQNTRGAELAETLQRKQIAHVFQKGTNSAIDSYSGFFDNARRKKTPLEDALRGLGVTTLDVVGLATDYCVKATVLDALELGFPVRVHLDGIRAVDLSEGDGARAIDAMRAAGAEIIR